LRARRDHLRHGLRQPFPEKLIEAAGTWLIGENEIRRRPGLTRDLPAGRSHFLRLPSAFWFFRCTGTRSAPKKFKGVRIEKMRAAKKGDDRRATIIGSSLGGSDDLAMALNLWPRSTRCSAIKDAGIMAINRPVAFARTLFNFTKVYDVYSATGIGDQPGLL
jgi:hypothetical protein